MNGKEMLDKAARIIARQDVDRDLMLMFMNIARRAVLRDRDIPRFYARLNDVPVVGGIINTVPLNLKSAKTVEHVLDGRVLSLEKIATYDSARRKYPVFSQAGIPHDYLEMGTEIYILPAPASGAISIMGEVWPNDLADSANSADITTIEIPEAWIYLAAAEYLDFFDETEKGNYWRQKGTVLIEQYITQQKLQATNGILAVMKPYLSTWR